MHTTVKGLIRKIDNISQKSQKFISSPSVIESTDMVPFIFLDGSSGMGKTQTAFTLMNSGYTVHFLLGSVTGESSQTIYKKYSRISSQFLDCVMYDCKNCTGANPCNDVNFRSKTCGFIVSLITKASDCYPMTIKTAHEQIVKYFVGKENNFRKIVIFLDEFPHLSRDKISGAEFETLRWMRNVFRYLHLNIICSSSSSCVANLLSTSHQSRDSKDDSEWCFVIPRFPEVLPTINTSISPFFRYLLDHSRPLFSQILKEMLLKLANHDESEILGAVGEKIHLMKSKFGISFAHGQLCLLMAIYHIQFSKHESQGVFSNSHFANLCDQEPFKLVLGDGLVRVESSTTQWIPTLNFPSPEEDILLFLCLMGNKNYWPICKPGSIDRIPMYQSIDAMAILKKNVPFKWKLCSVNPDARVNTGMDFESFAVAAVVLASHYGGLTGIPFKHFMAELLYEIGFAGTVSEVTCQVDGYEMFENILVPFFSAPSVPWPEKLLEMEKNICNLARAVKSESVYFKSGPLPRDSEKDAFFLESVKTGKKR